MTSPQYEGISKASPRAFCAKCSGVEAMLNGQCKKCNNKITPKGKSSPPQQEGHQSPCSPFHHDSPKEGFLETTTNTRKSPPIYPPDHNQNGNNIDVSNYTFDDDQENQPMEVDNDNFSDDQYDDDADREQLLNGECFRDEIQSNSIPFDAASSLSVSIVEPNYEVLPRNDNNNKRKRKKKSKKRKIEFDHYNNAHSNKKIKRGQIVNLISDDEDESNRSSTSIFSSNYNSSTVLSSVSNSLLNVGGKDNPITIDDEDEDGDAQIIEPDFDSPTPPPRLHNNNDREVSPSPSLSLSICSPFNAMTLGRYNSRQQQVMQKWEDLKLKNPTLRGLETIKDLKIPKNEQISLINAMRHNFKHMIGAALPYQSRIMALCIGLIEIMKVREAADDRYENFFDATRLPQVLVISPRRHQAVKIKQTLLEIGKFYQLYCEILIGGMPTYQCVKRLSHGIDVISATPGKLCDLIKKKQITTQKLNNIIAFAMDDADELVGSISMKNQMRQITSILPENRKFRVLYLESAMAPDSIQTAKRFIRETDGRIKDMEDERKAIHVVPQNNDESFDYVKKMTHIMDVSRDPQSWGKCSSLKQILRYYSADAVIVFFCTRQECRDIYHHLKHEWNGYDRRKKIYRLDSWSSNRERKEIMTEFETNGGVLLSTDLNSRGISLNNINILINYDLPKYNSFITYITRAGISTNPQCHVFSLITGHRNGSSRKSLDETKMSNIKRKLNIEIEKYSDFSRGRRHHPSRRDQSIINNNH